MIDKSLMIRNKLCFARNCHEKDHRRTRNQKLIFPFIDSIIRQIPSSTHIPINIHLSLCSSSCSSGWHINSRAEHRQPTTPTTGEEETNGKSFVKSYFMAVLGSSVRYQRMTRLQSTASHWSGLAHPLGIVFKYHFRDSLETIQSRTTTTATAAACDRG